MVKLSIIIPYYETFELTCRLLDSLIPQLSDDVEVIVVDDGCERYDLDYYDDKGITIFHKENGGVSSARNKGLELATGKYVAFIDSDDMVMPIYIDTLLDLIDTRQEDIITFNWLDINTNDVNRHPENPAVWKSIYKREILPRFDETLKTREDYFFLQELKNSNYTKYYYDRVLYIYNSGRENSLTWKEKKGLL